MTAYGKHHRLRTGGNGAQDAQEGAGGDESGQEVLADPEGVSGAQGGEEA